MNTNKQITITLTSRDFDLIWNTSMEWGLHWKKQKARFEDEPMFHWKQAYWFNTYLEALIAQHYLSGIGFESQTVFDSAIMEYVILTDYKSESVEA